VNKQNTSINSNTLQRELHNDTKVFRVGSKGYMLGVGMLPIPGLYNYLIDPDYFKVDYIQHSMSSDSIGGKLVSERKNTSYGIDIYFMNTEIYRRK